MILDSWQLLPIMYYWRQSSKFTPNIRAEDENSNYSHVHQYNNIILIISSILFRYIYDVRPRLNELHHFEFYRLSVCHLIELIRSFSMVSLVVLTLDMRNKPIWHDAISTILVVPPRLMYFHILVLKFHIFKSKLKLGLFSLGAGEKIGNLETKL